MNGKHFANHAIHYAAVFFSMATLGGVAFIVTKAVWYGNQLSTYSSPESVAAQGYLWWLALGSTILTGNTLIATVLVSLKHFSANIKQKTSARWQLPGMIALVIGLVISKILILTHFSHHYAMLAAILLLASFFQTSLWVFAVVPWRGVSRGEDEDTEDNADEDGSYAEDV